MPDISECLNRIANLNLALSAVIQVRHQGFSSGHPWRVTINDDLVARCESYKAGVLKLTELLKEVSC